MEVETMFTGPITIREATAEDIPFLQAMIWEAMLASPTFLAHYGVESMQQAEEQYWRGWIEHSDPAFVALDATGQKLGAITVKPNETHEPISGWRIGIGVDAQARGQGVGHRLIERAITFAKLKGASYANLFVDPTNTRAIALYQRIGFREVGEKDQLIEMRINLY
jgi:ribosomal protein S18 acetylase RimI-like enzyme